VIFCLAPVLWQVLTSFKVNQDIAAVPTKYFPTRYTLNHYIELFTRRPFCYILNSAFVSIVSTFVSLAIGAPAAYARLRPGGKVILAGVSDRDSIPWNSVVPRIVGNYPGTAPG